MLGHWPTPLERLTRLSEELGGPTIWVKRDDCTGLAIGGNKTRKLEYLLGDALRQGADTLVTFGAVQSNHARQTAAACARAGLACHQVLTRSVTSADPGYETNGNVLLGRLLGAHQHIIDEDARKSYTQKLLSELSDAGRRVYLVPAGGSNAVGALGYAACAEEILLQCAGQEIDPGVIVHASSSAGTQAGLLYGFAQLNRDVPVMGINVYHPDPADLQARVQALLNDCQALHGATPAAQGRVQVNHAYFGSGYGQPTPECVEAIHLAARLEGLLFDPVYAGKALAAMIDQINLGNFSNCRDVILLHTGGTPALAGYSARL